MGKIIYKGIECNAVMDINRAGEVLLEAKEIFDACGVEFFLICGTCLGAIRDGIIFPFDGDLDIGVKHEILIPKLDELEKAFLDKGYAVEYRSCQYGYKRSVDYRKDGIHICVRDYDLSGDKRFHARIIAPDNDTPDGTCSVFDKRIFEDLEKITFLGVEFLVPSPPEVYLKSHFGDWETPRPTDHRCQCDIEDSFKSLMEGKS